MPENTIQWVVYGISALVFVGISPALYVVNLIWWRAYNVVLINLFVQRWFWVAGGPFVLVVASVSVMLGNASVQDAVWLFLVVLGFGVVNWMWFHVELVLLAAIASLLAKEHQRVDSSKVYQSLMKNLEKHPIIARRVAAHYGVNLTAIRDRLRPQGT
jgi:hypothetical protein